MTTDPQFTEAAADVLQKAAEATAAQQRALAAICAVVGSTAQRKATAMQRAEQMAADNQQAAHQHRSAATHIAAVLSRARQAGGRRPLPAPNSLLIYPFRLPDGKWAGHDGEARPVFGARKA